MQKGRMDDLLTGWLTLMRQSRHDSKYYSRSDLSMGVACVDAVMLFLFERVTQPLFMVHPI